MTTEEEKLLRERFARIRRVKRLLRPLPRRATVHKYPFLKRFAAGARKRSFLWSFRPENVTPAFYIGSILGFLPLYGIQIPTALLLSVLLRANLPIFVGLQLITNPLTVILIYYLEFQIARLFLGIFQIETIHLSMQELNRVLQDFFSLNWGANLEYLLAGWGLTMLGGAIVGTFVGACSSFAYRVTTRRAADALRRLKELQLAREGADMRRRRERAHHPERTRSILAQKKKARQRRG